MGPYNIYPDPPEQRFYICPDRFDSDKDIDLAKPSSLIANNLEFPPLYLLDGYVHTPPSFKSYTIDIPGKNTKLDVTEQVYGDVRYENRSNEYEFVMVLLDDEYPSEPYDDPPTKKYMLETRSRFEYYKCLVYDYLHGQSFFYCVNDERDDFKFRNTYYEGPSIRDTRWIDLMNESETWRLWVDGDKKGSTWKDVWEIRDPASRIKNYDSKVFHGRFSITSFEREAYGNGELGRFKLKVDTDPYILYRNILPVVFTKEITIDEPTKHDTIWDEMITDSTTWNYWTDRVVEWEDEWERYDSNNACKLFQNEEQVENPKSLIGGCMYNVFNDPETDTDNAMPTRPIFQTPQDLTLIHNNKRYYLPPGIWAIPDFILTRSQPAFYLHAYPLHTMQWQEYTKGVFDEPRPIADGKYTGQKITWGVFKKHRLYWWNRYHGWNEEDRLRKWEEMDGGLDAQWSTWTESQINWNDELYIRDQINQNDQIIDSNKIQEIAKYYDSSYPLNIQTWDNPTEYKEDGELLSWGYYNVQQWFVHKNKDWWHFARSIDPRKIEDVIVHIERGCL